MTTEVEKASNAILASIEIVGLICIFIVYLVMMLLLSSFFTIFAILSFLIAISILKKILKISSVVGNDIKENNRKYMSHISQRFSNLRLLKLNGDEEHEKLKTNQIIEYQKEKILSQGY